MWRQLTSLLSLYRIAGEDWFLVSALGTPLRARFLPSSHSFIYLSILGTDSLGFQFFSGLYFSTVFNELGAQIVPDYSLRTFSSWVLYLCDLPSSFFFFLTVVTLSVITRYFRFIFHQLCPSSRLISLESPVPLVAMTE